MPVYNLEFNLQPGGPPHPDALLTLGLLLPVEVQVPTVVAQALQLAQQPIPPPVTGMALVDTGATLTCVHLPVLQQLGLNPVGTIDCATANGVVTQPLAPVILEFPVQGFKSERHSVAGVNLDGHALPLIPPQPLIALIGRDMLASMVLVWNGPRGMCTIGQ